jgi:hypothetical protein
MRSANRKCDYLLQLRHPFADARQISNGQKLQSLRPSQDNLSGRLQHIHFHGHYTFCGGRTSIDLDAVLANLALEEGDERLPQIVDSIRLDPEMLSQTA